MGGGGWFYVPKVSVSIPRCTSNALSPIYFVGSSSTSTGSVPVLAVVRGKDPSFCSNLKQYLRYRNLIRWKLTMLHYGSHHDAATYYIIMYYTILFALDFVVSMFAFTHYLIILFPLIRNY